LTNSRGRDYDTATLGRARKISGSLESGELDIRFGSSLDYLEFVQDVSESIGRLVGFDDDGRYWISLSVRESVTNAILHGNKLDTEKKVGLSFEFERGRLVIRVVDEGKGFDESALPDPLDPSNLLKPSGRGIFYVRSFMDEVSYRSLPRGGWEVRMEKKLQHNQGERSDDD
jgi:serine/threonine-protein kinase RsbW